MSHGSALNEAPYSLVIVICIDVNARIWQLMTALDVNRVTWNDGLRNVYSY